MSVRIYACDRCEYVSNRHTRAHTIVRDGEMLREGGHYGIPCSGSLRALEVASNGSTEGRRTVLLVEVEAAGESVRP